MMTQKGDLYTKLFSTLSGVRIMSCGLSQLNILCSNLVKPFYTNMTIHPLFTVHTLRPFYVLSNVSISSKWSDPYVRTFVTLSGVRKVFWILPQLDILCISAVKRFIQYVKVAFDHCFDTPKNFDLAHSVWIRSASPRFFVCPYRLHGPRFSYAEIQNITNFPCFVKFCWIRAISV